HGDAVSRELTERSLLSTKSGAGTAVSARIQLLSASALRQRGGGLLVFLAVARSFRERRRPGGPVLHPRRVSRVDGESNEPPPRSSLGPVDQLVLDALRILPPSPRAHPLRCRLRVRAARGIPGDGADGLVSARRVD